MQRNAGHQNHPKNMASLAGMAYQDRPGAMPYSNLDAAWLTCH